MSPRWKDTTEADDWIAFGTDEANKNRELRVLLREAADLLDDWHGSFYTESSTILARREATEALLQRLRAVLPQDEPTP